MSRSISHALSDAALLVAAWLAAVLDESDLAAAWPLTDDAVRLATAQSWIMLESDRLDVGDTDRDLLATVLADPQQPAHPLWEEFSGWRIIRWRQVLPVFVTEREVHGTVSGDHPLAPDIEAVWITRSDGQVVDGAEMVVQRFLVRQTDDGWRFAGVVACCRSQAGRRPRRSGSEVTVTGSPDLLQDQRFVLGGLRTRRAPCEKPMRRYVALAGGDASVVLR